MTTAVKICGITDSAALDAARDAKADFIGFVFFPKSPRNLDIDRARALRERVPRDGACKTVALVVDPSDRALAEIVRDVDPDVLQLHGHETLERVAEIRNRFGKPVMKAIPVSSKADVAAGLAYLSPGRLADILLFDAKPDPSAALPGGNGLAFDWHILQGLAGQTAFALAGGLNPDNVAEAIARTGAAIVDVSSGVESAPGVKEPGLIRRFLQAAKAAKQGAFDASPR
ncbi:MAG: phosphoribosylanthranilate isomerase [Hyphomicrobium sp.]|jgi:phosphoribosylanthranilate isomerase|nr:phosphoribosylanthranilate isomerase [Hyphomicrobium sp.]